MKTFSTLSLALAALLLSGCTVTYTKVTSDIPAIATWGQKVQQDIMLGQPCGAGTKEASVAAKNTNTQVRKGVVRQTSELKKECK